MKIGKPWTVRVATARFMRPGACASAVLLAAGLVLGVAGQGAAQAVLELDLQAGRTVVDDPYYVFNPFGAVDYDRRLVYVVASTARTGVMRFLAAENDRRLVYAVELADPMVAQAYSLADGSVVGTYGGREGEGPGEVLWIEGLAASPDGVLMGGRGTVVHWRLSGEMISTWRPTSPMVREVCFSHGRPVVAAQKGVVVRAENGRSVAVGNGAASPVVQAQVGADPHAASARDVRMACVGSVAYVLAGDVITGYGAGASPQPIPVPPEIAEVARRRRATSDPRSGVLAPYSALFADDRGRLVVTVLDRAVTGAVIDPAGGCYELFSVAAPPTMRHYLGMAADSLIFVESVQEPLTEVVDGKREVATGEYQGRDVPKMVNWPRSIAIRPLELVSGQRCGG